MRLTDFTYELPKHLIAQSPLLKRDQARLMIVNRKSHRIIHDHFFNIGIYLPSQSSLVLNDSKVIPARLRGYKEKTGGKVDLLVLRKTSDGNQYEVLLRPRKNLKPGDQVIFDGNGLKAIIVDPKKQIVEFNCRNFFEQLNILGHMPLPPYIKRADEPLDREYYQTVYASQNGSIASPTAGLHFTEELLNQLIKGGHPIEKVTLHINHATFKPVNVQDIRQHIMHGEEYAVSPKSYLAIEEAKGKGRKIVAVGTTSCRVLEHVARTGIRQGETELYIYPGFEFRWVDGLLTNFHLPQTTLLILVCAFASVDLIQQAYQEAIKNQYRFYSYGDAMLII